MSLYNMLHGYEPGAAIYLAALQIDPAQVGRFRDCYLKKEADGTPRIVIYTRTGGGNREHYETDNAWLQSHPLYLKDYDDAMDCTYAHFEFKVPDELGDALKELPASPTPAEKFEATLKALRNT